MFQWEFYPVSYYICNVCKGSVKTGLGFENISCECVDDKGNIKERDSL